MSAINLFQLNAIAAFLEASREHLGIEHAIRLHWPRRPGPIGGKPRTKVARTHGASDRQAVCRGVRSRHADVCRTGA